jgi:hypothetical protein
MTRPEDLKRGAAVRGIFPYGAVTVVDLATALGRVRRPCGNDPDAGATGDVDASADLLSHAEEPR